MRGQIAAIGGLLAVVIVALVVPMVGSMLKEPAKEQASDLPVYTEGAIDILVGRGVPEAWTKDNVKKPGLVQESELLETRLIEYQKIPYVKTKELLGLGAEDYVFILLDQNGNPIFVGDKQSFGLSADTSGGNGAVEWDQTWNKINDAALNLIKAERAATYKGQAVKLMLFVWSSQYVIPYTIPPACSNTADDDVDGFTDFPWDPDCTDPNDPSEHRPPIVWPECFDRKDNDGDSLVDFPIDPGCDSAADNSEINPPLMPPECSNSGDDDGDGYVDFEVDPGCSSAADDDEFNLFPDACSNSLDDDRPLDGKIDYPFDPGCTSTYDDSETDPVGDPACNDGIDNDVPPDSLYDFGIMPFNDPGCESAADNDETDLVPPPQCSNGGDDDLPPDGKWDFGIMPFNDPGCVSLGDNDESDESECNNGIDDADPEDILLDFPLDPGCKNKYDIDETDLPQCADGIDNDMPLDGKIDYRFDPGCVDYLDNDETDPFPLPECFDGSDNADPEDTIGDFPLDPGCRSAADTDETDVQCTDGIDNDHDGWIDYPNDPDCVDTSDTDEWGPGSPPQCTNYYDDDGDGNTDFPSDAGCASAGDTTESPDPLTECSDTINNLDGDAFIDYGAMPFNDPGCLYASDDDEMDVIVNCNDNIENDGDGLIDYPNDPGCASPSDTNEFNYALTQCSDTFDNDGDILVDYPADPGCVSAADDTEWNPSGSCGNGVLDGDEECEVNILCTYPTDMCWGCYCSAWPQGWGWGGPGGKLEDTPDPADPPPPPEGGKGPHPGDPPPVPGPTTPSGQSCSASVVIVIPSVDNTGKGTLTQAIFECCHTDADCTDNGVGAKCYAASGCGSDSSGTCGRCSTALSSQLLPPMGSSGNGGSCASTAPPQTGGAGVSCGNNDCPAGSFCVSYSTGSGAGGVIKYACQCESYIVAICDGTNTDSPVCATSGAIVSGADLPGFGGDQAFILLNPGTGSIIFTQQPVYIGSAPANLELQAYSQVPSPFPVTMNLLINGIPTMTSVTLNNYMPGGLFQEVSTTYSIPVSAFGPIDGELTGIQLTTSGATPTYYDNIAVDRS